MPYDRITPLNGTFFPSREKIVNHFTSTRVLAREGHVPVVKLVFPGGGASSPRYIMMSPKQGSKYR